MGRWWARGLDGLWRRRVSLVIVLVTGSLGHWATDVAWADEVAELKAQVEQLQQDNRALQAQVSSQHALTERMLRQLEALEQRQREVAKAPAPGAPIPGWTPEPAPIARDATRMPRMDWRAFAEVGFATKITGSEDNSSFLTEDIDLFVTSELSDRISVLLEADFFSPESNTMSFSLQRLNLRYVLSDWLNVKLGRLHTALGYWNETFHHGSWLQTTVSRPEVYRFERDEGGFLPVHSVGIELAGDGEWSDVVDVGYRLALLNGRGRTVTEVQHVRDKNDSKAVSALLRLSPAAVSGLTLGPMAYWDRIPGDPPTTGRTDHIDELILGGYATYLQDPVEVLAELFQIHHDDKTSEKNFNTLGSYLQVAYRLEKLKPYYRFDYLDVANADPYFTGARRVDRTKHTLGVRWDAWAWNALKFEYGLTDRRSSDDEHVLMVNSSFTF